ncbi:MAG: hypothetical protein ACYDCC_01390 [Actinomycetota bacterium]
MLTLRSRLAAAAGLSAAGVVGVLISQRMIGSAAEALIAVVVAAAAAPAMALNVGESVAELGREALARQARFAPAFAIAVIAVAARAHSTLMTEIERTHVSATPLLHGHATAVVGMWFSLFAFSIAIAGSIPEKLGSEARLADRMSVVAFLAQVGLASALFVARPGWRAEPKVVVSWIVVSIPVAAFAWIARGRARDGIAPFNAFLVAVVGLILVAIGAHS